MRKKKRLSWRIVIVLQPCISTPRRKFSAMHEEQPMGTMLSCMEYVGVLYTKERRRIWWARIISVYFAVSIVFGFVPCSLNIIYAENFFKEGLESLGFILAGLQATTKHFNILFRQDAFMKVIVEVQSLWQDAATRPQHRQIADDFSRKSSKSITRLYVIVLYITLVLSVSTALIDHYIFGKTQLPLQVWTPLKPEVHGFLACCLLQSYLVFPGLLVFITQANFAICILEHIAQIIDFLVADLEENRQWTRQERINVYVTHSRIINVINDLNSLFGGQWMLETVISASEVTLRAYMCQKASSHIDSMLLYLVSITLVSLLVVSITPLRGSLIDIMGDKLQTAIYSMPWYDDTLAEQKEWAIILAVSQRSLTLNYRSFTIFDRALFLDIVKTAYTYLAILQAFDTA